MAPMDSHNSRFKEHLFEENLPTQTKTPASRISRRPVSNFSRAGASKALTKQDLDNDEVALKAALVNALSDMPRRSTSQGGHGQHASDGQSDVDEGLV